MAQFIPLNLTNGVSKLNNLIEKVVKIEAESDKLEFKFKSVMDSDGMVDHEALKENLAVRDRALDLLKKETG